MNAVTLGDFLHEAGDRFERAVAGRGGLPTSGAIPELRRITLTALRYLDIGQETPADPKLGTALALAANRLKEAGAAFAEQQIRQPGPRLRALIRTADLLQAGGDLLHTHQASAPDGHITDRSDWASLLRTPTIVDAMTEEASYWADRIANGCEVLAGDPTPVGSPVPGHLNVIARTLRNATRKPPESPVVGNGRAAGWELLYAIPSAFPPARTALEGAKSAEQLADQIGVSSVRLKAAAFAMPDMASWSAGISSHSWRNAAHTAAVILDAARFAADVAADYPDAAGARTAAIALNAAHEGWRRVGETWDAFATDSDSPQAVPSLTSIEAGELALPLCRLVLNDPQWKPRRGGQLAREAIPPLREKNRFRLVLGAIHQASDAVARMGTGDVETIRRFASAGRLYMPNRILADPRRGIRTFVPAPNVRVELLIQAYEAAIKQTTQAVDALDELVVRHKAASRPLAMARKIMTLEGPERRGPAVDSADVTRRLAYLRRPMYSYGIRSDHLDHEAVVSAYRDDGLTLSECADRFTTTPHVIKTILDANDVPVRSSGSRRQPGTPAEPVGKPGLPKDPCRPVESEIRARGVADSAAIAKARDLDQVIARQRLDVAAMEATPEPGRRTNAEKPGENPPARRTSAPRGSRGRVHNGPAAEGNEGRTRPISLRRCRAVPHDPCNEFATDDLEADQGGPKSRMQ